MFFFALCFPAKTRIVANSLWFPFQRLDMRALIDSTECYESLSNLRCIRLMSRVSKSSEPDPFPGMYQIALAYSPLPR